MNKQYSQDELNQILLAKPLNEFYLAIIENKQELLTDEEYNEITKRDKTIYGDNKDEIGCLFKKIQIDEHSKDFAPDLMKVMYSLAQIRHMAILTIIGDDIYDIGNAKFEDLKRNKIIYYDNLTNYYDETNARIKLFTKEEEPQLTQKTALLDVDDETVIYEYESSHLNQKENEDLTKAFFDEIKGKTYTLKRK